MTNVTRASDWRDVWVYCEHEGGELTKPTLEILGAGRKVADALGQRVVAVIVGYRLSSILEKPLEYGADEVVYCDDPQLKEYLCLTYSRVITELCLQRNPGILLFIANEIGRDLAPRVSYRLKTGLATDNIDLSVEDFFFGPTQTTYKNILAQIRPDFATRVAKIYTPRHRPQVATVRPGNFQPLARQPKGDGMITSYGTQFAPEDFAVVINEVRELPRSPVDIEGAQVVVSLGLGILRDAKGNPRSPIEGYQLAKELAQAIRDKYGLIVEIGASRALIYAELRELHGLITGEHQVGQTGKTVSPEIYFALGISGAVQHRVGMIRSKKIVAVNLDPGAPIFDIAHYAIIGDIYEEVPKLTELISRS